MRVDHEALEFIARKVVSNIRELEGAVTRVIGFASLAKQEISVELARRVLRDVFTVQKGQPTMEDVMRVVTAHFNVKLTDLQSRRRTNAIAHPRQRERLMAEAGYGDPADLPVLTFNTSGYGGVGALVTALSLVTSTRMAGRPSSGKSWICSNTR